MIERKTPIRKPPPPPKGSTQVNVRLSGVELRALQIVARENGITKAQVLRELLRAHVAERIRGEQLRLPGAPE